MQQDADIEMSVKAECRCQTITVTTPSERMSSIGARTIKRARIPPIESVYLYGYRLSLSALNAKGVLNDSVLRRVVILVVLLMFKVRTSHWQIVLLLFLSKHGKFWGDGDMDHPLGPKSGGYIPPPPGIYAHGRVSFHPVQPMICGPFFLKE